MGTIRTSANTTWRDYVIDGVSTSGAQPVRKTDIRETFGVVEDRIEGAEEGVDDLDERLTNLEGTGVPTVTFSVTEGVPAVPVPRAATTDVGVQLYETDSTGRIATRKNYLGVEVDTRGLPVSLVEPSAAGALAADPQDSALTIAIPADVYSADHQSDVIDLQGLGCARIEIFVSAGGITFSGTNKIEFVARDGDDPASLAAVDTADIGGQDAAAVTSGIILSLTSAHDHGHLYVFTYIGGKKYLDVKADFSGTHGTGTGICCRVTRGVIGGGVLTTTQTGPTVNLRGAGKCSLVLYTGRGGITFTGTNKVELRVEHFVSGAWADTTVDDWTGDDAPTSVTAGVIETWDDFHGHWRTYHWQYVGGAMKLRATLTFSGTHATGTHFDLTFVPGIVTPLRLGGAGGAETIVFDPTKRHPLRDPQVPRVLRVWTEGSITRALIDRADRGTTMTVKITSAGEMVPDDPTVRRLEPDSGQSLLFSSGDVGTTQYRPKWPFHLLMPKMASGIDGYMCGLHRGDSTLIGTLAGADIEGLTAAVDRASSPGGVESNIHGQTFTGVMLNAQATYEETHFGAPTHERVGLALGIGGAPLASLNLGSTGFDQVMTAVDRIVELSDADDMTVVVDGFIMKHGENDSTGTYVDDFRDFVLDYGINIMCKTGQASFPTCFVSQISVYNDASQLSNPAYIVLQREGWIELVGPDYPLKFLHAENLYRDNYHLYKEGTNKSGGAWFFAAWRKVRWGVGRFEFLEPIRAKVNSGLNIDVTMHVPSDAGSAFIDSGIADHPDALNGVDYVTTGGTARTVSSMGASGSTLTVLLSGAGSVDGTNPTLRIGIVGHDSADSADRQMTRIRTTLAPIVNPVDLDDGRTYHHWSAIIALPVEL